VKNKRRQNVASARNRMLRRAVSSERETVKTQADLAARLGIAPAQISQRMKDGAWRAVVLLPDGKLDVQAALEDQQRRREKDKAKIGGELQGLKATRLQQQIDRGAVELEEVRRQNELRKIEHDAKRGEWMHRADVEALCRMLVSGCDRAVRAVGQVTRSTLAEAATREALDEWRRKAARWIGKAKGATP